MKNIEFLHVHKDGRNLNCLRIQKFLSINDRTGLLFTSFLTSFGEKGK